MKTRARRDPKALERTYQAGKFVAISARTHNAAPWRWHTVTMQVMRGLVGPGRPPAAKADETAAGKRIVPDARLAYTAVFSERAYEGAAIVAHERDAYQCLFTGPIA